MLRSIYNYCWIAAAVAIIIVVATAASNHPDAAAAENAEQVGGGAGGTGSRVNKYSHSNVHVKAHVRLFTYITNHVNCSRTLTNA